MLKHIIKKTLTNIRMSRAAKMSRSEKKKFSPLSQEERKLARYLWGGVKLKNVNLKLYDKGYRIYKTLEGFDEKYCPNTIFEPYIVRALNLPVHVLALEHKAFLDVVFNGIKQPKTVLKKINGVFFDKDKNIISLKDAFSIISTHDTVCIKPTAFSAAGNGVKKLDCKGLTISKFEEISKAYGENLIIQEIVKQSPKTAALSSSSLNTFRVSSLFINGKCSVCTIMGRIGRGDSFVDNGAKGNYMVGVDPEGQFRDKAYDWSYQTYKSTDNGIKFSEVKIEEIKDLIKKVEHYHPQYLPNCGFCGWDFALDENNEWNLIEVNLYAPGIEFEQICPGRSLFGERTKEVIDYVNTHQPSLLAITTSLG